MYDEHDVTGKRPPLFPKEKRKVDAANFCATVAANVDNEKLSDADFREFIRNTLPIVDYPRRKCDLKGCDKDAELEGWVRVVDWLGLPTGMTQVAKVCGEHKPLLIGAQKETG